METSSFKPRPGADANKTPSTASIAAPHKAAPLGNSRIQFAAAVAGAEANRTIVTDPDHDSIWVLFNDPGVTQQIELEAGSEPGDIRIATDPDTGNAVGYVSLHNRAEVLALPLSWPASIRITYTSIPVCASPRGMDFFNGYLYVACGNGDLLSVDVKGNFGTRTMHLTDGDLKDVVVLNETTAVVSQFRSAQLLQVNLDWGTALILNLASFAPFNGAPSQMRPEVAWQMIPLDGHKGALIAHQLASIDPIVVGGGSGSSDGGSGRCETVQSDYGPPSTVCSSTPVCSTGVVAAAVSKVELDSFGDLQVEPLAVLTPMIPPLTIARVGQNAIVSGLGNGMSASVPLAGGSGYACTSATQALPPGVAAVGYPFDDSDPTLPVVFARQQGTTAAQIGVASGQSFADASQLSAHHVISSTVTTLPYAPVAGEEGRDLFHAATPSLMSCASCHPNGREDGHTWNFSPMGPRRTPSLGGGLLATAPFHWDGAEQDISQLMTDVFVGRMSGTAPTSTQVTALSQWLDGLPVAHAASVPPGEAIAAGKALFESPAVGCTTCHSGSHFTNNLTMDVGTGGAFQVPTLLGLGSRAPYLHDGRASTLEERFDPRLGGGDQHGHTSQLTPAEIANLVAYLRTL